MDKDPHHDLGLETLKSTSLDSNHVTPPQAYSTPLSQNAGRAHVLPAALRKGIGLLMRSSTMAFIRTLSFTPRSFSIL